MTKSEKAALVILGAAVGVAVWRFFSMPDKERKELVQHIKKTTVDLLDNAEETVEKVDHFIGQIDQKGSGEWIDKLYLLRKMFRDLYGSGKRFLL
ncbi:MAG: YtxH domain-containing protein [Ginsengibacter sp.]